MERGFEIVHDLAVFAIGDFGDAKFGVGVGGDPSGVEYLAAARGVEGGAVENECGPRVVGDIEDFSVEVVEEGILVVEAVRHGESF